MEDKLNLLFNECLNELSSIGMKILNNQDIGEIDIAISKRNNKRYGCCRQEEPDETTRKIHRTRKHIKVSYDKYRKHHIEISRWVMNLDEDIIKNTIIHEIIHCMPYCNNHGTYFKHYANIINQKLGYNIQTLGNKEVDYLKSNLEYKNENNEYNYKILCKKCGAIIYRKRLKKDLIKKYRCGKCKGKLELLN